MLIGDRAAIGNAPFLPDPKTRAALDTGELSARTEKP
jgi:hypothetical protein